MRQVTGGVTTVAWHPPMPRMDHPDSKPIGGECAGPPSAEANAGAVQPRMIVAIKNQELFGEFPVRFIPIEFS